MKQHKIDWLNMPGYKGETWNPIIGCSRVSEGCMNCYAEKMAGRLAHIQSTADYGHVVKLNPDYLPDSTENQFIPKWTGETYLLEYQLDKPLKWKKPRMVFVCSMSDLFHENTDFEQIELVFDTMNTYRGHLYLLLTKRPERMQEFFNWYFKRRGFVDPLQNIWLGVSAENQEQADKRIPILLQIPATKRFVSIEPMLGPVDVSEYLHESCCTKEIRKNEGCICVYDIEGAPTECRIDWVICGGESGHKGRPMHPDWARSLRDQCKEAGIPFFLKQWGEYQNGSNYPKKNNVVVLKNGKYDDWDHEGMNISNNYSSDEWNKLMPTIMSRVGKHKSGSELDGQFFKQFPEI